MIKEMPNSEIVKMIGKRLKTYRINQDMTQKEMSLLTNISVPTIQQFETGRQQNITLSTLLTLLRHTGLIENVDKLIPEEPVSPYRKRNKTRIRHAAEDTPNQE